VGVALVGVRAELVVRVVAVSAVHLGPVEADHGVAALGHEEPLRVEPRLGHPPVQVVEGPGALLRVPGERPRVQRDPRLVVRTRTERAYGHPRR
jgi:hypothetical protein